MDENPVSSDDILPGEFWNCGTGDFGRSISSVYIIYCFEGAGVFTLGVLY
jgi:hypothetical protein